MIRDDEDSYRSPTTDGPLSQFPELNPPDVTGCMRRTCYFLGALFFLLAGVLLIGGLTGHIPWGWGRLWKYAALAGVGLFFVGRSGYGEHW
ncbi:hypothetical protein ACFL5Q_05605 [Planctomycetota bacterium]